MDSKRSNQRDKVGDIDTGAGEERQSEDSTWGEGSASALQNLRSDERRRARNKPTDDRPAND